MTATIYGIKNCDTIKKARAWMEAKGLGYDFHDYKTAGVTEADLTRWIAALGWDRVLNRAGTTFRALPETERADLDDAKATRLMLAQPSMIKRPILETGGKIEAGFKPEAYEAIFG